MATVAARLALLLAAALPAAAPVSQLVGDSSVASVTDSDGAALAEAFAMTATTSGALEELNVYLDATSSATKVTVGLYSDASSHPRTL